MEFLIICLVAFFASGLTLFSGFGLGTILLPAFGLFFPIEVAVALTAVVHFLNNLFKLSLLGRYADWATVLRFGFPSLFAAFLGAWCLGMMTGFEPLMTYEWLGKTWVVMPLKVLMALVMVFFALFDLIPRLASLAFDPKYQALGGVLSGFIGGLSGHQGALRSAFLLRLKLEKQTYLATGIVIACLTDVSRITVYAGQFFTVSDAVHYGLLATATGSAFLGAYLGNRLLEKVTLKWVQGLVAGMLICFAIGLGMGWI